MVGVISDIGAVLAVIPPILVLIGKVSLGLSTVVGLFSGVAGGAAATGGSIMALSTPVGWMIAAIAAVIAIIVALWKNNEDFRNAVITLWNNLKDFIVSLLNLIKSIWGGTFDSIKAVAKASWDYISVVFTTAVKIIGDIFKVFAALFKGDWSGLWNALKNLFSDVWNGIGNVLSAGIKLIVSQVTAVGEIILAPFKWAKEKVVGVISDIAHIS